MPKKYDHMHKYERKILGSSRVVKRDGKRYIESKGGYVVFKCMIPGCPHFVAREILIGRKGLCWACNKEMVMDMENTELKRPTHSECRKMRVARPKDAA